jgi:peptidoglycan/LPS O-acetylase OafA/YrhL
MAAPDPSIPNEHLSHPKYRPDIDGLRAIAVLSVVGFHAFPGLDPGGFAGVDIFFVISGYLISTIIFENLDKDRFSFVEFYSRRVRRIFPALIAVLLACLAFGWFDLLADEFAQLGEHVAAGAGFVSNLILWRESGYFDNASATKPLLHLWSLGIEEQFYIFWPLLLWLAWKWRWSVWVLVLVVWAGAFAVNIVTVGHHAVAAFYSPLSRFWELLTGAAIAYVNLFRPLAVVRFARPYADAWSLAGFAAIVLSVLLLDKDRQFPGWWALLPTTGAAALIFAGPQAIVNRRILANRALVWVGLISFPLYLWHWPLLSLAHIDNVGEPSQAFRVVLVLAAIALAWLTYRFIERPLRFGEHSALKTAGLAVAMAFVGATGYFVAAHDGLEGQAIRSAQKSDFYRYFADIPAGRWSMDFEKHFHHECNLLPWIRNAYHLGEEMDKSCYQPDGAHANLVLVWGDSHAQMINYGLRQELPPDWQVLQVTSSGCAPSAVDETSAAPYCRRSNAIAMQSIRQYKPQVVVIAQKERHEIARMYALAQTLRAAGVRKVVFMGPVPQWTGDLPKLIVRRLWIDTPERTFEGINAAVRSENDLLLRTFKPPDGVVYVDLFGIFCDARGCLTRIGDDRKRDITTWDYGHLTPLASVYLARHGLVAAVTGAGTPAK